METLRVYELARLLELESREVLDELGVLGIDVTTASNSLKTDQLERAVIHFSGLRNGNLPVSLTNLLKFPVGRVSKPEARAIPKTAFQVNPSNLTQFIDRAKDGDVLHLDGGEYKGPIHLNRRLTLIGKGHNTVLFATNEPAVKVMTSGVRFENLCLDRTNGGTEGEIVLDCAPGSSPDLLDVHLIGTAPGAQVIGATWEIPQAVNYGQICAGQSHTRELIINVGSECHVTATLSCLTTNRTYLAPGQAILRVTVDGSAAIAGTKMHADVLLKAIDGQSWNISVVAEYIASRPVEPTKVEVQNTEIAQVAWGVTFVRGAAQRFMSKIGIETDQNGDYRNDAVRYLCELNGNVDCLYYLRKRGSGDKSGQLKWELTIATDNSDYLLPKLLLEQNVTLKLSGVVDDDGYDSGMLVLDASFIDARRGCRDAFALPLHIKFEPYYLTKATLPDEIVDAIDEIPDCKDYLPTADQLTIWDSYVAVERRIAEARQFCVPYEHVRYNVDSYATVISFKVDAYNASLSSTEPDTITVEEFWKRAQQAKNDLIKLLEDDPFEDSRESAQILGRIEQVDRAGSFLRIRLDEEMSEDFDTGELDIPRNGWLLFDAFGNITEVKRKEISLKELRAGKACNPFLGSFFFDSRQARSPEVIPEIKKWLDPDRVNDEQRLAVEKVMAAQDLALIWGPPGTGKTTVIAEICYQVAQRGGRTLIASQTNLAVDNAMSRLVHDPSIRALRKGKASKVEDEGKQYTEKYVIGTWLNKTSAHCQKSLSQRREKVDIFRRLLADQKRLSQYIQQEEQHRLSQDGLWQRLGGLKEERDNLLVKNNADNAALDSVRELISGLAALEEKGARWSAPELVAIQQRIMPLISQKPQIIDWQRRLTEAARIFIANGINHTDLPALALVEQMQEISLQRQTDNGYLLYLADQALQNVTAVRDQFRRKGAYEKAVQTAQLQLPPAQEAVAKAAERHVELTTELEDLQVVDIFLSSEVQGGEAIDWLSPRAHALQESFFSYFKGNGIFTAFEEDLQSTTKVMERLGLIVPELPPLSRAESCRRTLAILCAKHGDPALLGDRLLQLTAAAHERIDWSQKLQIKRLEHVRLLQEAQKDVDELSAKTATLHLNHSLIRDSQHEFAGWIEALQGQLNLTISLGITTDSHFSIDSLPPLPLSLKELIGQIGKNNVPWLGLCDQFVAFLNQVADKIRQRSFAYKTAREMRLMLDQGLQIIGSKNVGKTAVKQPVDGIPYDLESLQEQARSVLSRIQIPLSVFDRLVGIFGESRRRLAEHHEITAIHNRLECCLAAVPAAPGPDELSKTVNGFLTTLSNQGEAWLKRGCDSYEKKVADNLTAKAAADQLKRRHEDNIRCVEKEMAALNEEIDPLVEDISAPHEGLQSLGLHIDSPSADVKASMTAMFSYLTCVAGKVKRWCQDVSEMRKSLLKINPSALIDTLTRIEKSHIDKLTVAVDASNGELNSARSRQYAAEAALKHADELLEREQKSWDANPYRSMAATLPFSNLPKNSRLFKILTPRLSDLAETAVMEGALNRIQMRITTEEDSIDSARCILDSLGPMTIFSTAHYTLTERERALSGTVATRTKDLAGRLNPQICEIDSQIELQDSRLKNERSWWQSAWESMPQRLREQMVASNIHDPAFLRTITNSFPALRKELNIEEAYLKRYEELVGDWIDRLGSPSDQDAADLRTIYLANANVIGITCSQAAAPYFSREFPEFDVVIVDEVSKCTPPELMMPALKGKKLVLVGDHRQLPPMIQDKTIEDVATEAGIPVEELSFIKTSTFNTLYTGADDQIKQDLRWQYRMHPSIMGAINQFYDHRLKSGIVNPETVRAHGLGNQILKSNHHLVWVNTPLNATHREQKEGTSYFNLQEVEVIERICRQMDDAWAPRVIAGEPRKEIAIITFYLPQLRKIRERINGGEFHNLSIRAGTVDRFQGMERPVVIVSLVRNNAEGVVGFAKYPERVNVAFSRAQELLMIVGCRELFVENAPVSARKIYQEVSNEVRRHGGMLDVSDFCR